MTLEIASGSLPPVVEASMAGWLSDLPSRDHTSFTSVDISRKPTLASFAKARDPGRQICASSRTSRRSVRKSSWHANEVFYAQERGPARYLATHDRTEPPLDQGASVFTVCIRNVARCESCCDY